jgi:hypothetical protein
MTQRSEEETQSGYSDATATERGWTDREKSELASSTVEAGERAPSGPCGGKALAELRNFLRERGGGH